MTPDLGPLLEGVRNNRQQWQKLADEAAANKNVPGNNNNNNYTLNSDCERGGGTNN